MAVMRAARLSEAVSRSQEEDVTAAGIGISAGEYCKIQTNVSTDLIPFTIENSRFRFVGNKAKIKQSSVGFSFIQKY